MATPTNRRPIVDAHVVAASTNAVGPRTLRTDSGLGRATSLQWATQPESFPAPVPVSRDHSMPCHCHHATRQRAIDGTCNGWKVVCNHRRTSSMYIGDRGATGIATPNRSFDVFIFALGLMRSFRLNATSAISQLASHSTRNF